MVKILKRVIICLTLAVFVWCGMVLRDKQWLQENVLRLHVVANSDSAEDQSVKLQVRDAVIASLQKDLEKVKDVDAARAYLQENLPIIEKTANEVLELAGFDDRAVVSLCEEAFDTRFYDTFTLPAGIYEALRITIGEGAGKNWWCVVFPSLCIPATAQDFEDTAVGAGFTEELSGALSGKEEYQLRFFLLDAVGTLENIFFDG